ncbi:MAG: molybdopterin dinucleotide binding domain-containing protein [Promethearchaeota archaeon]|jgi:formylmethanofuran dehydrogenase subunit D
MEMVINTVRMIDNDQFKEFSFGDELSLKENLAIGFLNPDDFRKLNLTPNLNLKLSNESGQVTIKIKEDKDVPSGTILMPVSIWANQITGTSKGQLIFKNIKVKTEVTEENVLSINDLIEIIKK